MWKYQEKSVDKEIPQGTTLQDLFLKVTEKEAGQQLAEGVALAHSAQVMEIQDMDYENQ